MGRRPKDAAAGRGGKDRPRQKNTGGKYQRADGRWGGSFTRHAGDRTWVERTTQPTEEAINEWLRDQAKQEALGKAPLDDKQSVEQFLTSWLNNTMARKLRPTTFATYQSHIENHLIPLLGSRRIGKLAPQHIEAMLNKLATSGNARTGEPLTPATIRYIQSILTTALNQAVRWKVIAENPALLVDRTRIPRRNVQVLTPDEARVLLAAVQGTRLEALVTVAMSLGLRRGEALGLRWQDVDLDRGILQVEQSIQRIDGKLRVQGVKNETSVRVVNLPAVTVAALRRHRARQENERLGAGPANWVESGLVFTAAHARGHPGGGPMDPRNFKRALDRVILQAGLPHTTPHRLRHLAASLLLAQGVQPKMISEILGHADIRTTMNLYSHLYAPERLAAASKMDAILGAQEDENEDE
jgi:integrase